MAEITSKSDLTFLSGKLNTEVSNFLESASSFESYVSGLEAVDGIDPTILGRSLCQSLQKLASSSELVANNIASYISDIEELDQYDQNSDINTETTPDTSIETTPDTSTETTPDTNVPDSYTPGGTVTPTNPAPPSNEEPEQEENKPIPIIPIILPLTPEEGVENGFIKSNNIKSESGTTPQSSKKNIRVYRGDPNVDISKYKNDPEKGFKVTAGNIAYELSEEDINILSAIVAAQSDKTYDDALAIMTTILNRSETHNWIEFAGRDPMLQATAKNLFAVYNHGRYKEYLNNVPEPVYTAVRDCLKGVRNHKYLEINPNKAFSDNYISSTGNRYR